MKQESQEQESSKNQEGESNHDISQKSYSPPLSPLKFPQPQNNKPSSSLSSSPSSSPLHDSSPTHREEISNESKKMKQEPQEQESSKNKEGESNHDISQKSYSPSLSPLKFPQPQNNKPSSSLSSSPSSSPLHDSSPTHREEIFHTNEFRLTPPEDQNHQTRLPTWFGPLSPVAAQTNGQEGGETQEEVKVDDKKTLEKPYVSIVNRERRQGLVRRAMLGLRIIGFMFCLISFSVMAADKKQGWASDSFSNYKEFRYCLTVNVLGFVYSGIQIYDLVYYFTTGKHVVQHHLRYYFDFLMDQILTYLVMSASSSAATRVEDWESNWGKDKFPDMARASVALSFIAFFAFASSSLISGYTLCALRSL